MRRTLVLFFAAVSLLACKSQKLSKDELKVEFTDARRNAIADQCDSVVAMLADSTIPAEEFCAPLKRLGDKIFFFSVSVFLYSFLLTIVSTFFSARHAPTAGGATEMVMLTTSLKATPHAVTKILKLYHLPQKLIADDGTQVRSHSCFHALIDEILFPYGHICRKVALPGGADFLFGYPLLYLTAQVGRASKLLEEVALLEEGLVCLIA